VFKLLAAIGAFEYDPTASFCQKNFLRFKAMQEIQQLRGQIGGFSGLKKGSGERLKPPTETQVSNDTFMRGEELMFQLKVIRQILTSAFIDQIAVRADLAEKKPQTYLSARNVAYRLSTTTLPTFTLHPHSSIALRPTSSCIASSTGQARIGCAT
jgi:ATP-dependent RNA helicase DHX37/DHR1